MSRSFYLAGRYSRREELAGYAQYLQIRGWIVTSRWLFGEHSIDMQTPGAYTDAERAQFAADDLGDVMAATELLYFTEDFEKSRNFLARRGGRHVELGVAIGCSNRIHVIGPKENIFCYLGAEYDMWHYATFEEWLNQQ